MKRFLSLIALSTILASGAAQACATKAAQPDQEIAYKRAFQSKQASQSVADRADAQVFVDQRTGFVFVKTQNAWKFVKRVDPATALDIELANN